VLVKKSKGVLMKSKISGVLIFILLTALSLPANSTPEEIEVGALIKRVIAGEDFSGKEIVVTGIALNQTTSGDRLVNIGTNETYKSRAYLNFVSVYDTSVTIKEGKYVSVRVQVETSMATKLGGKSTVLIESAFLECLSC